MANKLVNEKNIFETDKCILIVFKSGASGKFLSNCLGFNHNFHIQSKFYFKKNNQQIDWLIKNLNEFKLKFNCEEDYQKNWQDLNLGDQEFYNVINFEFNNNIQLEEIKIKQKKEFIKSHMLHECVKNNKFFFKVCHDEHVFLFYKQIWKNAKIIIFKNQKQYIQNIRKYQENLDYIQEFDNLLYEKNSITFDCMCFHKWDLFLEEYTKILNFLNCNIENTEKLKNFYDIYSEIMWKK